ncbi:hypothetical protein ACRRTK_005477 [Alexandromys fortis]
MYCSLDYFSGGGVGAIPFFYAFILAQNRTTQCLQDHTGGSSVAACTEWGKEQ